MHTPERVPSMPKADATRTMAATQMKKAALLEDLNMLLLMTMPEDKITTAEAREYLRLRKGDELKKLRRKLAVEEDRERSDAASVEEEVANPRRPKRRRQRQGGSSQYEEGEGSQPGCGGCSRNPVGDTTAADTPEAHGAAQCQQEGVGTQGAEEEDGNGVGNCEISLSQGSRGVSPRMGAWVGGMLGRLAAGEQAVSVLRALLGYGRTSTPLPRMVSSQFMAQAPHNVRECGHRQGL